MPDVTVPTKPGTYRVAFEHRTAWNATLTLDPPVLHYVGDTEKQNRDFPLDGLRVPSKPAWGELTRIAPIA